MQLRLENIKKKTKQKLSDPISHPNQHGSHQNTSCSLLAGSCLHPLQQKLPGLASTKTRHLPRCPESETPVGKHTKRNSFELNWTTRFCQRVLHLVPPAAPPTSVAQEQTVHVFSPGLYHKPNCRETHCVPSKLAAVAFPGKPPSITTSVSRVDLCSPRN